MKPNHSPYLVLALGGVGLLLQVWLLSTVDKKTGLLASGHPAATLLLLLTLLVLLLLLLTGKRLGKGNPRYDRLFPASQLGAVGSLTGAAGIFLDAVVTLMGGNGILDSLTGLFGILAAICLVVLSKYRRKGQKSSFLLRGVVCVYLLMRLVCRYRDWSAEPQMHLYIYPLLAQVFLTLATFHRTCFDVGMGKRRQYVFFNLGAVFFCCLSIPNGGWLIYLTTGFWMFTELCTLRPLRRRRPKPRED